jgi:hypothetical protein
MNGCTVYTTSKVCTEIPILRLRHTPLCIYLYKFSYVRKHLVSYVSIPVTVEKTGREIWPLDGESDSHWGHESLRGPKKFVS